MSFELALRATEVLLGLAILQQCAEHLLRPCSIRWVLLLRAALAVLLIAGWQTAWMTAGLFGTALVLLRHYQGPYNGGSDRMGMLVLLCLCLALNLPERGWQEVAFGYLAVQLVLSYFVSGQVKIRNPDWRSGRALQDVFLFSAYPVSGELRALVARPGLLWTMSWAVMVFEILFPLALLDGDLLVLALILAALFHLANACSFGLNRFLWVWLSAFPSLLWFQDRLFLDLF